MASMIFASSPLSAQSFVKLRTNSNYSHSPCYISRAKNSYIHLPYNNISHIDSSKSLFLKGDSNFSFSSPKFPRVASTNSPSLNIIKATIENENIYHFRAHDMETGKNIHLDIYKNKILLIVNLPQKIAELPQQTKLDNLSYKDVENEIKYLNELHGKYTNKKSLSVNGFEVLGFFPHIHESKRHRLLHWLLHPWSSKKEKGNPKLADGEEEIYGLADFPIFRKVYDDDDNNEESVWRFLKRETNTTEQEPFDKFLVDWKGKPLQRYPWFVGETLKPMEEKDGGVPHDIHRSNSLPSPFFTIQDEIDKYFPKQ